MAKIDFDAAESGKIINYDVRTGQKQEPEKARQTSADSKLVSWVVERVSAWKSHRNTNYSAPWDQYERLWRGIYSEVEKQRGSERSRIVSPALSEAVENGVAEIEEAAFGRGDFFYMGPEDSDTAFDKQIFVRNEKQFKKDLAGTAFTENCAEAVILAAVYGTGIAEIIHHTRTQRDITAQMGPDGTPEAVVTEKELTAPVLRSVSPRNFVIDPAARTIEDALGVAIEEDVGYHLVREGIDSGEYQKIDLSSTSGNPELKADPQIETPWTRDVVTVIRYYGKVPKSLLFPPDKTASLFEDEAAVKKPVEDTANLTIFDEDQAADDSEDSELVEAVVIIANDSQLLKGEESRDMMRDRPVLAFQWDKVPGRFWGRGICEKGAVPAKLLDAELRSRIDALAFTSAPMMAMDASRLPRGFKLEVYPGKNVLLAGNPSEILKPFKFGELDQNSGAQVELLDRMVQRATGSIDTAGMATAGASGDARSGAMSMAMSGVVKRNKRTLMRYLDKFLAPALQKLMWRYMQYAPGQYMPVNFSFNVSSTMGIMQREYDTMGMTQLLNSMQPGTSEQLLILMGLVRNSGMQDRDMILQSLARKLGIIMQQESTPPIDPATQAPPPDPVAIELQRQDALITLAKKRAEYFQILAETDKIKAETQTELVQPQLQAESIAMRGIYKTASDQINEEFNRRLKAAQVKVQAAGIASRERIADKQIIAAQANEPQPVAVPIPMPGF